MSVAVSESQLAMIRRFFSSHAAALRCPACGMMGWEVLGIAELNLRVPEGERESPPLAGISFRTLSMRAPVVLLACQRCAFIAQFSWSRIEADHV